MSIKLTHWAHTVFALLKQRQWRWSNVATTSSAQWIVGIYTDIGKFTYKSVDIMFYLVWTNSTTTQCGMDIVQLLPTSSIRHGPTWSTMDMVFKWYFIADPFTMHTRQWKWNSHPWSSIYLYIPWQTMVFIIMVRHDLQTPILVLSMTFTAV